MSKNRLKAVIRFMIMEELAEKQLIKGGSPPPIPPDILDKELSKSLQALRMKGITGTTPETTAVWKKYTENLRKYTDWLESQLRRIDDEA